MALLPRNPRTGGLLGAFANPLTMGGLGMLMQGPSLTPQSPFAGFGQGAMMGMGMQQQMRQAEIDRQKMELAQQKFEAEQESSAQAASRAAAERAARVGYLTDSGMPREQAELLVKTGRSDAFIAPEKAEPLKAIMGENGLPIYVPASEAVGQQVAQTPPVALTFGGEQYKPQTDIGKLNADLQNELGKPEGQRSQPVIESLRAKIKKATEPTAEVGERDLKYKTAGDAMDRFMTLAAENDKYLGPMAGRITRAEAGLGTADATQAELASLEATMITRLGTALSGAAIPEQEWPRYFAQVPGLSDSAEARAGKAKTFRETLQFLEEEAARRRGEPSRVPLPESETVPRGATDASQMSTEDLLKMISP